MAMDEGLATLVTNYESRLIVSFPDFLDQARLHLWKTYRLQACFNGPITRTVLLEVFAAICRTRQHMVIQILKYDLPRPNVSVVSSIGAGLGLDESHTNRLIAAVNRQAWTVQQTRNTGEAIDWPVFGHSNYILPTATALVYAGIERRKASAIFPEVDLASGTLHPCNYYRIKRRQLGLSIDDLAETAALPAVKLSRLEYDPQYHLAWPDIKRLAVTLKVSANLLREAHAERPRSLSSYVAAVA